MSYTSNNKREELNSNLKKKQRVRYRTWTHDPQQKSNALDLTHMILSLKVYYSNDLANQAHKFFLTQEKEFVLNPLSKDTKSNVDLVLINFLFTIQSSVV